MQASGKISVRCDEKLNETPCEVLCNLLGLSSLASAEADLLALILATLLAIFSSLTPIQKAMSVRRRHYTAPLEESCKF